MKIICRHGHIAFYPSSKTELVNFKRLFKLLLVAERDYFTFETLVGAPNWSQTGRPYGGIVGTPAVVTFAGDHPWEVMEANGFVFSLTTRLLVPYTTIVETISLKQTQDCLISSRIIPQPGSVMNGGNVLLGYHGEIDLSLQQTYLYALETLL